MKDKPNGVVTVRVPFGNYVNQRTRMLRDQESGPMMREKSKHGGKTFALTADVAKAHRQIPIDKQDCHLLGCQVVP